MAESVRERNRACGRELGGRNRAAIDEASSQQPQVAAVEPPLVDVLHEKSVTEHLHLAAVPDPAEIDLCAYELTGHGFHAPA